MSRPKRIVHLTFPQAVVHSAPHKTVVMEMGRGSGKSTCFGLDMREMAVTMPRGKFYLTGTSYRAMKADTLPSTFESLERLGFFQDIHYMVGKRGPSHWPIPFQAPNEWSNVIHFYTGAAFVLISQDPSRVESRGHNFDGGLGDECAQLDPVRYFNECLAATRTDRPEFREARLYRCERLASSTPMTREGQWMFKYEADAEEENARVLRGEQFTANTLYVKANAYSNAHNLAPDWFEKMERKAISKLHFRAEILNVRPSLVKDGFYPKLKSHHLYSREDADFWLGRIIDPTHPEETAKYDLDYDPKRPLILTVDPGAHINVAVAMQMHKEKNELRALKEFWLKHPSVLDEMIDLAVEYYHPVHHPSHRTLELFYDRTANSRQPNSRKTLAEEIAAKWRKKGWKVNMRSFKSGVIIQDEKYHTCIRVFGEEDRSLFKVRINKDRCRNLVISMQNAEAVENRKGLIEKDKKSERRLATTPREQATDLSDAADLPIVYYAKVKTSGVGRYFSEVGTL
jgi:hypothetical protein